MNKLILNKNSEENYAIAQGRKLHCIQSLKFFSLENAVEFDHLLPYLVDTSLIKLTHTFISTKIILIFINLIMLSHAPNTDSSIASINANLDVSINCKYEIYVTHDTTLSIDIAIFTN